MNGTQVIVQVEKHRGKMRNILEVLLELSTGIAEVKEDWRGDDDEEVGSNEVIGSPGGKHGGGSQPLFGKVEKLKVKYRTAVVERVWSNGVDHRLWKHLITDVGELGLLRVWKRIAVLLGVEIVQLGHGN